MTEIQSILSFNDVCCSGQRENQCQMVLNNMSTTSIYADRDLAEVTGLSLTIIPDRRARLVQQGKIIFHDKKRHHKTGKLVSFWQKTEE